MFLLSYSKFKLLSHRCFSVFIALGILQQISCILHVWLLKALAILDINHQLNNACVSSVVIDYVFFTIQILHLIKQGIKILNWHCNFFLFLRLLKYVLQEKNISTLISFTISCRVAKSVLFPVELVYFYTVVYGVHRLKWSPRNANKMDGTPDEGGKKNMIELVLMSNWAGFVSQIWQPWFNVLLCCHFLVIICKVLQF